MDLSIKPKMNVTPVFVGKVIIKNKKRMPEALLAELERLSREGFLRDFSQNRDIIIRLKSRKPGFFDSTHKNEDKIFNLTFSSVKENSWLRRFLDPFNYRAHKRLAHNYHHERNIIKRLNDIQYVAKLKDKLFKKK